MEYVRVCTSAARAKGWSEGVRRGLGACTGLRHRRRGVVVPRATRGRAAERRGRVRECMRGCSRAITESTAGKGTRWHGWAAKQQWRRRRAGAMMAGCRVGGRRSERGPGACALERGVDGAISARQQRGGSRRSERAQQRRSSAGVRARVALRAQGGQGERGRERGRE